jgi:hypothetical protein
VEEGAKIGVEYLFNNIGKQTLEIEIISACDCMMLDWTTTPIPPAAQGKVTVVFDSAGHPGDIEKNIDVIFKNTDEKDYPLVKQLALKIKVLPKK